MAIRIGNVVKRDLQEQVEKNKQDIAKHYEIDRVLSDWGIKVLGVVNTPSDIPEGIYEYGDAYGVRTGSGIVYYVWTRANINVGQYEDYWLDIGALSIVGPTGPQGLQGPQGIQGVRGSVWVSSTTAPVSQIGNNGDQWLNTSNGDVYQKNSNGWTRTGNIKGPQGIQGATGPKGEQGIPGSTGPQGPKGDTGSSFTIGGLLQSTDNLPIPTEANRSIGYAVKREDDTYDLYVVVGTNNLQWVNMGRVEGVEGPQGPVGPQGPAGVGATIIPLQYTGVNTGTLTQSQLNTVLTATYPIINLNNEYFMVQDLYPDNSEMVLSHVGNRDGALYNKTFTLNTITGDWVLKEVVVQEIIDISEWGDTVPEEYRNLNLLKKSLLRKDTVIYNCVGQSPSEEFLFFSSLAFFGEENSIFLNSFDIEIAEWSIMHYEEKYISTYFIGSSSQIIEDQGKLELATYNLNNDIIDINDTPNQFLQRNLNKPSKIINNMAEFSSFINANIGKQYFISFNCFFQGGDVDEGLVLGYLIINSGTNNKAYAEIKLMNIITFYQLTDTAYQKLLLLKRIEYDVSHPNRLVLREYSVDGDFADEITDFGITPIRIY